ncbi:MAG TPA: hypothetical protein VMM60_05405 [Ilumatobacter sp.]|nr:hypothetical protein [Ilumatobacter sp.]
MPIGQVDLMLLGDRDRDGEFGVEPTALQLDIANARIEQVVWLTDQSFELSLGEANRLVGDIVTAIVTTLITTLITTVITATWTAAVDGETLVGCGAAEPPFHASSIIDRMFDRWCLTRTYAEFTDILFSADRRG